MISHRSLSRRHLLGLTLILPALPALPALAGCADEEPYAGPLPPGSFVGQMHGTDVRVAVAAGESQTLVFFCGSATSLPLSRWFRAVPRLTGTATDAANDPWKLNVWAASTGRVEGSVDPGEGRVFTFTAGRMPDDGIAGLYEYKDDEGHASVIVSGDEVMQGLYIQASDGKRMQIVPVRPGRIELTGGILPIRVGSRELGVSRVRPG